MDLVLAVVPGALFRFQYEVSRAFEPNGGWVAFGMLDCQCEPWVGS
jgi:hypothetical protein